MYVVFLKLKRYEPITFISNFKVDCDDLKKRFSVIEDCACVQWNVSSLSEIEAVLSGFDYFEQSLNKTLHDYENNNDLSHSEH